MWLNNQCSKLSAGLAHFHSQRRIQVEWQKSIRYFINDFEVENLSSFQTPLSHNVVKLLHK